MILRSDREIKKQKLQNFYSLIAQTVTKLQNLPFSQGNEERMKALMLIQQYWAGARQLEMYFANTKPEQEGWFKV